MKAQLYYWYRNPKIVVNNEMCKMELQEYGEERDEFFVIVSKEVDCDDGTATIGMASTNEVAVYSFALKPEEHQPSGTCNFSRIDNAQLKNSGTANTVDVYAVNYNVLRVMSGMGGLAYSN